MTRLRRILGGAVERVMRSALLWSSRRHALGRFAKWMPLSRPIVARFVAGESLDAAMPAVRRLRDAGYGTTLDILGESVTSEAVARDAAAAYGTAIRRLAEAGLDRNVSVKLSQMGLAMSLDLARENVASILAAATEVGAFVRIDMEDHATTGATLDLVRSLRPTLGGAGDVGVVLQSALRRTPGDAEALIAEGVRVRLCKGAYKEPADVAYPDKADVDAAYIAVMERLLLDGRYPALATHDDRIVDRAVAFAREHRISPDRFEFQMLYGVRRDLQERLVRVGWTVRVYVPTGSQWYPYFMRRLAERPANVVFLAVSVLREGRRRGR